MSYKSMLIALLGLSLTGCAVYGDSYDHDYRGYDRHYSSGYHNHRQVQRYPVYVAPRYYGYDDRRHDRHRYDDRRHDQRRYAPAPPPRYSNHDRRPDHRYDGRRDHRGHDYRAAQPRQGWDGRHYQLQQRSPQYRQHSNGLRNSDKHRSERRHN